ncbi:hypothetical protein FOCC_FOCC001391 [Frankliniella occidentalis]|nr:hypothetical protein FOCC_FOCC001391 [Frankliniella occidentalis]
MFLCSIQMGTDHEFLPLCDVLFNIISLAGYFCDVVFDLVMSYALYRRDEVRWFAFTLSFILISLIVSQIVSVRWYLRASWRNGLLEKGDVSTSTAESSILSEGHTIIRYLVVTLHFLQCGVLWRYFKLFIPVDLRFVKHEVRELCLLRLIHAFVEAAPMLLLQLYLLWQSNQPKEFSDLNMVSTILSLFSVCWALASFSKNVRLHNIHRLVLTWLGVIFQFFWRLGTVWSRMTALAIYATLYGYWVLVVIALHWICMFLWLISPKHAFYGEQLPRSRKLMFSALVGFIYVFAFINLQESNHRQKMAIFYTIMFLENSLLVAVWLVGVWSDPPWYKSTVPLLVFSTFFGGLSFMALYYRYFHVRRLKYDAPNYHSGTMKSCGSSQGKDMDQASHRHLNGTSNTQSEPSGSKKMYSRRITGAGGLPIPGVFNCRFANASASSAAAALKRKKKKPTTFVPPPSIGSVGGRDREEGGEDDRCLLQPDAIPFWCRPLSRQLNHQGGSSENEGSCARADIQQKLQEKKQKQLAELRVIEEEILQGKLQRRDTAGPAPQPVRQPAPYAKRHRAHTPEILLAPRFLHLYRLPEAVNVSNNHSHAVLAMPSSSDCVDRCPSPLDCLPQRVHPQRAPSDMESQISLPRSYTLPRQFKYYRQGKARKNLRTEHFVASTNSSDGDVDSGDENDSGDSSPHDNETLPQRPVLRLRPPPFPLRGYQGPPKHETKL